MFWRFVGVAALGFVFQALPVQAAADEHDTPAPPAVVGELRVATINMWGIPYVSTFTDERFRALADRLNASDLDVVGLQEMWADGPRLALRQAVLPTFPYQVDFHTESGGSGLVILSRHPISAQGFTAFPANGKWWWFQHGDWWGRKGVGAVRVELPEGPVWFATTHLIAHYTPRLPDGKGMGDQYAYDRWHQTHVVRSLVAALAGDTPAIVVGDFNFRPGTTYYRYLSGARVTCPGSDTAGQLVDPAWIDTAAPARERPRIDMIWIRPGAVDSWRVAQAPRRIFKEKVTVADVEPQAMTDHPAVAATLTRTGGPAAGSHLGGVPQDLQTVALTAPPANGGSVDASLDATLGGWRATSLAAEAGHGGELAAAYTAGVGFIVVAGFVLPWRLARARSVMGVVRGALGAGCVFLGFAILQGTMANATTLAQSYAFWLDTRDCVGDVGVPQAAARPSPPPQVE